VRIAGTANLFPARRPPPGARPGEFVLPEDAHPTRVRAVIWDADRLEQREVRSAEELMAATETPGLAWIQVVGLGDGAVLGWIRDVLGVHPLAVADIANVPQRPKFEDYGDRDLVIAQHVRILEDEGVEMTQVSLVASPRWVVSVLEEPCDELFAPIEERLRTQAPIRRMGADYLAYAILDGVIDGYFPVLEAMGELLEELEEEITAQPGRNALVRLHAVRRVLMTLHRTMWRQRDALGQILRGDEEPFGEAVRVYFRDAHDHALQVLDAIESYREVTVGLMDVYLSSVSNRLNEVMKTLTIIGSIFIPLTFIVGVYGMNFDWMPELRWRWGYPAVWVVMIAVALGLLWWFRQRGWLGDGDGGGR
jgi:magnesium transporter